MFAIRKNNNLLVEAKNIFGEDIVKDAYIATYSIDHDYHQEFDKQSLDYIENKFDVANDQIDFDFCSIIIVFSNGKHVLINATEFGTITNVKEKTVEK